MDYTPNTDAQLKEMLAVIGAPDFEALIEAVPQNLRAGALNIPSGETEAQVLRGAGALAQANRSLAHCDSFLGCGAYKHLVPTAVDAIACRGEWLTPYTPYQAEASQGILQGIYEFQSMVCELMGMDVANASVYDGASAAAEAVLLAARTTGRSRVVLSETVHPHVRQVIHTYLDGSEISIQELPSDSGITDLKALEQAMDDQVACVLLQHPNVLGCLEPMEAAAEIAHKRGALFAASVYPVSLGLLQPPGAYGADIAVAEASCFGTPMNLGGPGLGLLATTQALVRRMPGRLVGETVDKSGRRAYTLTLQTREQHIRREKATSNICTNQGWIALRATIHMSMLGKEGLRELAQRNLDLGHYLAERLQTLPWATAAFDRPFFNEFTLAHAKPVDWRSLQRVLRDAGIEGGYAIRDWYPWLPEASVWCATECLDAAAIDRLVDILEKV